MIRGIVDGVIEGAIKRISMRGMAGETISDREYMQHYGFTSRPLPGAEAVLVREGNHLLVIASDDRRYRLGIEAGEAALYDDQGQVIRLKRDKTIHIYGCDNLIVDAALSATVNSKVAEVNASESATVNTEVAAINAGTSATVTSPLIGLVAATKVTIDSPLAEFTGNLSVAGGVSSLGTYGASGGKISTPGDIESTAGNVADSTRSLAADRAIYNSHDHPGDSGGTTGTPNQGM